MFDSARVFHAVSTCQGFQPFFDKTLNIKRVNDGHVNRSRKFTPKKQPLVTELFFATKSNYTMKQHVKVIHHFQLIHLKSQLVFKCLLLKLNSSLHVPTHSYSSSNNRTFSRCKQISKCYPDDFRLRETRQGVVQ